MLTLQQSACISAVKNLSLSKIVEKFDSDFDFRRVCSEDPVFWRKVVSEKYGDMVLLKRLDLRNHQLLEYVRRLLMGLAFRYSIKVDLGTSFLLRGPMPYYTAEPESEDQGDEMTLTYYLEGSVPDQGSMGYITGATMLSQNLTTGQFHDVVPYRIDSFSFLPHLKSQTQDIMISYFAKMFLDGVQRYPYQSDAVLVNHDGNGNDLQLGDDPLTLDMLVKSGKATFSFGNPPNLGRGEFKFHFRDQAEQIELWMGIEDISEVSY